MVRLSVRPSTDSTRALERPAGDASLCRRAQPKFGRARHRRDALGGDVEIERALAHEIRHELRNPPDPDAAQEIDQRIGALRRDLARDLSRPSGAMRPRTRALAPARSTMSRVSTSSAGPSDRMRAEIRPVGGLLPALTPRASRMKPTSTFSVAWKTLDNCGSSSRLRLWIATCASSLPRSSASGAV